MKKLKPYLFTTGLVLAILIIVFLIKGIYPFGNHSLIWGDMHDQITAFYYHFYDCFYSNKSLFIDFSASGGVNYIGILAYYIISPFSFLVLLVSRDKIYLVVSVIIALKILLCSLTCLYFIRYYFKKIPSLLSVMLAIIYAFSGYSLIMYQITPWIDAMYMFPLIMIGLKKVLDFENPTWYIITLSLSLIFSFYVSMMVIIFILLASFIYILVYRESKEEYKKAILALGITTIISLLLASFIIVPAYLEISISYRMGFSLKSLLNSKMGPITDKLSMFLFGGIMYTGLFLLLKNYKNHKKFLSFYLPVLFIVLIPAIIEPINKVWHFGSYAFFPYRFGFITMFLLILGASYSFEHYEAFQQIKIKRNKMISIVLTLMICVSTFSIMFIHYTDFQIAIETLTISVNHTLLLILVLSIVVSIIGCLMILLLNRELNSFSLVLISVITVTHILINTSIYLGMDYEQEFLMEQYQDLQEISRDYQENDYYRVKSEANNLIMNSSLVMKYHSLDHFTSLTDRNNLQILKKMGYSSMWVKTFSRGGNLFIDSILANKYIMTNNQINYPYYQFVKKYGKLNFYQLQQEPSYGYLMTKNDTVFDKNNSFEISNSIYQNITGKKNSIFEIFDDFESENMKITKKKNEISYKVQDKRLYSYIEKTIPVHGTKTIYLEVLKSLINNQNYAMYEQFDIYINGYLYQASAFNENDNGVLNLGTYQNEFVRIRINFNKSLTLHNVTIGVMDNHLYEEFLKQYKINGNVVYHKNKVQVDVDGTNGKILFLPLAYNNGYHAKDNGKTVNIIKLYDNFIGIPLETGTNHIEIYFIPSGFKIFAMISIVTLIVTIGMVVTKTYSKLLNISILENIAYYSYLLVYIGIVLCIYIGLTICFMLSYFITI